MTAYRHNYKTNASFMDGHVASHHCGTYGTARAEASMPKMDITAK
jgi:prepilin-type processing-associated H-X9-DG protein